MLTATTKLQLSTAALAMAAAAVITPVAAQADVSLPAAPSLTSFSKALGSTAGAPVCDVTSGVDCATLLAAAPSAQASASSPSQGPLKNNILWYGGPNLPGPTQNGNYWNNPNTAVIQTFTPLNSPLISWAEQYFPGLWAWWNSQSQQNCILGFSTSLGGPYSAPGTYTRAFNKGGCNPS